MKRCSRCKVAKPLREFGKAKRTKDGLQTYCQPCFTIYSREWRARHRDRVRAAERERYAADPEKGRARQKQYRSRHRERLGDHWKAKRRRVTLAQYGMTVADYERMLAGQGQSCAICRSDDPVHWSGKFQIDHHHGDGTVRGLLCAPCNGGLGMFADDPDRMRAAIAYLTRLSSAPKTGD